MTRARELSLLLYEVYDNLDEASDESLLMRIYGFIKDYMSSIDKELMWKAIKVGGTVGAIVAVYTSAPYIQDLIGSLKAGWTGGPVGAGSAIVDITKGSWAARGVVGAKDAAHMAAAGTWYLTDPAGYGGPIGSMATGIANVFKRTMELISGTGIGAWEGIGKHAVAGAKRGITVSLIVQLLSAFNTLLSRYQQQARDKSSVERAIKKLQSAPIPA